MNMLKSIRGIEHRLNPLHVYCRLIDAGLSRDFSGQVCRYYEVFLFRWIVCITQRWTTFWFLARERVCLRYVTMRRNPPC